MLGRVSFFVASVVGYLFVTCPAYSQPSGLRKKTFVSSGKTDVASEGFEGTGELVSKDDTELAFSAGAFIAAGNSRSLAATLAEQFRLRRGPHQLSINSGVNFGRSSPNAESDLETTVENYQLKARYDHFLSEKIALFFGASARNDRFQGLALRVNFSPGASYYFLDEKAHRLWGELGYNLQHDIRTDAVREGAAAQGAPLEESETRHFGRVFLGYSANLNDVVSLDTGLEYLPAIHPYEDDVTGRNNWRLGFSGGFTSKVSEDFSVATTVTVDYDHNPLPGIQRTDAVTSINLVYTLL